MYKERVILDEDVEKEIGKLRKQYDQMSLEVVIETEFDLTSANCRYQECVTGNLLCDVILEYQQSEWEKLKLKSPNLKSPKPSIAIIHAGHIRSTFPKGSQFKKYSFFFKTCYKFIFFF